MTNWHRSYGVSFEFWEVDKDTFKDDRRLYGIEDCEIVRDSSDPTLGDATMTVSDDMPDETYVRVYLLAEQPAGSGNVERVCLGTMLSQVSEEKSDGKVVDRPLELSTPLKELDEDNPPAGYTVRKDSDAIEAATRIFSRFHVRVKPCSLVKPMPRDVTANDSDTWLTFGRAVLEAVSMEPTLDPYGYVGFAPVIDASAMTPVKVFVDDDVSIIEPDVSLKRDRHKVPNVVEVKVSTSSSLIVAECRNDDKVSPVSTVQRGRIVRRRVDNPEGVGTLEQAKAYARRELKKLSCSEREITYTHGYCEVSLGNCVGIYYSSFPLDIKAKVVRQVIRCQTDFEVEETARYTEALWNG